MPQNDRSDLEAARRPEEAECGVDGLDVPTSMPRDDVSVIEVYAENAFNMVIMPVWDSIRPETLPTYPGWRESLYNILIRSWYNTVCILAPLALAWAAKFEVVKWGEQVTFVLCFVAMIPLQKTFDWGGEQMGLFLGKEPGDFLVITLSNAIEAALAIILLFKCELRLLQSTIIGVVLLHLLLIPGVAFFVQGIQVYEQKLSSQFDLNHSLLMTGVLGILVPTVFFAALDQGSVVAGNGSQSGLPAEFVSLVSDSVRWDILRMSRGISIMLIIMYLTSCLYRHHVLPIPSRHAQELPLHEGNIIGPVVLRSRSHSPTPSFVQCPVTTPHSITHSLQGSPILHTHALPHTNTAINMRRVPPRSDTAQTIVTEDNEHKAEVNPWLCMILLVIAVAFMGATAEFLVTSIQVVLETSDVHDEHVTHIVLTRSTLTPFRNACRWLGLVLLPIISFSADGIVVAWNFSRSIIHHFHRRIRKPKPPRASPHRPRKLTRRHPVQGGSRPLSPGSSHSTNANANALHIHETPSGNHAESQSRPTHTRGASSATVFTPAPGLPSVAVRSPTMIGSRMPSKEEEAEGDEAEVTKNENVDVEAAKLDSDEDADEGRWLLAVPELPWASEFAHGRPIDLSIQFTLWWMPFLVLLGWWTDRPMHLLFDYFEIGMLLGACFLVNWVTSDAKTNMSEGLTMISFYVMIATAAWWYPGQPQVSFMLNCPGSVAEALATAGVATLR